MRKFYVKRLSILLAAVLMITSIELPVNATDADSYEEIVTEDSLYSESDETEESGDYEPEIDDISTVDLEDMLAYQRGEITQEELEARAGIQTSDEEEIVSLGETEDYAGDEAMESLWDECDTSSDTGIYTVQAPAIEILSEDGLSDNGLDSEEIVDDEVDEVSALGGSYSCESVKYTVNYYPNEAISALDKINELRKAQNLRPYKYNKNLEKKSRSRATEIALNFRHTGLMGEEHYNEIILYGADSAQSAVDAWDKDESGNSNRAYLYASYKSAGIAHVVSHGSHYWVLVLGNSDDGDGLRETPTDNYSETVTKSIRYDFIKTVKGTLTSSTVSIKEGTQAKLPKMNIAVYCNDAKPSNSYAYLQNSPVYPAYSYVSGSGNYLTLSSTSAESQVIVTAKVDGAAGKPVNTVKLKASYGSHASAEFTVRITCNHHYGDVNIVPANATTGTDGDASVTCTKCGHEIKSVIYAPKKIGLKPATPVWNGLNVAPAETVTDRKGKKVDPYYYRFDILSSNGTTLIETTTYYLDDAGKLQSNKAIYNDKNGVCEPGNYICKVTFPQTSIYEGELVSEFTVTPKDISSKDILIWVDSAKYAGDRRTPDLTMYDKKAYDDSIEKTEAPDAYDTNGELYPGYILEEGVDYILEYFNNSNAGKGSVTITGIGRYAGTRVQKYDIKPATFDLSGISVTYPASYNGLTATANAAAGPISTIYTGSAIKPQVSINVDTPILDYQDWYSDDDIDWESWYDMTSVTLTEGVDYTVTYKYNTNVGKADAKKGKSNVGPQIIIKGKGNYKSAGTIVYYFNIENANLQYAAADGLFTTVKKTAAGYTKAVKPEPKITYAGKTLKKKTNYTIEGYWKADASDVTNASYDAVKYLSDAKTADKLLAITEPGDYVVVCKGTGYFASTESSLNSAIAVPIHVADADEVTLMSRLKISVSSETVSLDNYDTLSINGVYPTKVTVKNGKTDLSGLGYLAKNANTKAGALAAYNKAVSEAGAEDRTALEADVYVSWITGNRALGTAVVHFAAIEGHKDANNMAYTGVAEKSFKISGTAIKKAKMYGWVSSMEYDRTYHMQNFGDISRDGTGAIISNGKVGLTLEYTEKVDGIKAKKFKDLHYDAVNPELSDYFISYSYPKGVNVGNVTVVVTGNPARGFTGSYKKNFKVVAKNVLDTSDRNIKNKLGSEFAVLGIDGEYEYKGKAWLPRPVVTYTPTTTGNKQKLVCNEDYTLKYSNNLKFNIKNGVPVIKAVPSVTIRMRGNFKGNYTQSFNIYK